MRRRDFVRPSVGAGLALAATTTKVEHADTAGSGNSVENTTAVQPEDGVVIHSSGNDMMQGSPPADNKAVTLANYESSRAHHSWSAQHLRELCPTQVISRGRGPVALLPRNPRHINALQIKDLKGQPLSVAKYLARSYTEAFLVLHQGQVLTEQYFAGTTPDTPHRLYSVGKSLLANVVAAEPPLLSLAGVLAGEGIFLTVPQFPLGFPGEMVIIDLLQRDCPFE
jgi:hypothetical protein